MTVEQLKQTKYYQFIVAQKYLVAIGVVTVVMLIGVIFLSSRSNQPKNTTGLPQGISSVGVSPTPAKKGFSLNPLDWFASNSPTPVPGASGGQKTTSTQPGAVSTNIPRSSNVSSFGGAPLTQLSSSGLSLVATSNATSSQTSGSTTGSTGGSSGGSSGSSSAPTPTPPIQMLFENPDGTTTNYIPPRTPPTEIRWGRYTSYQDNYAIDYPVNWQIEVTNVSGHQGVAVFAPGTNKNAPGTPYIGFGLTPTYLFLAQSQLANALDTPLLVDGISGKFYTDGPLGNSYMASILPYREGNFGLGSNFSDETFAYVYYFMLHSLRFNVQ